MDIVNQTRELGDPTVADQVDLTSARNQLHRTIATSKRRGRMPSLSWARGGLLAGGGALAIGALVVGAGVLAPTAAPPASAAEVLESAADAMAAPSGNFLPGAGQFLRITQQTDSLILVGRRDGEVTSDVTRGQASAAVIARYTSDYFTPADFIDDEGAVTTTPVYALKTYGDDADARELWLQDISPDGTYEAPAAAYTEVMAPPAAEGADAKAQFEKDLADFPTDPAQFRAWWADKFDVADSTPQVTESLMSAVAQTGAWVVAPEEFRATLLRALALDDSLAVAEGQDGLKTVTSTTETKTMAVVIDGERDVVTGAWTDVTVDRAADPTSSTDGWKVVGPLSSAAFLPQGVHDEATTFTYEVVDQLPAIG